jgi:hypothetical protein
MSRTVASDYSRDPKLGRDGHVSFTFDSETIQRRAHIAQRKNLALDCLATIVVRGECGVNLVHNIILRENMFACRCCNERRTVFVMSVRY